MAQVEIVMGLEEAFQISVDESSAQEIQTVGDAAALIDKLITEKVAWKDWSHGVSLMNSFAGTYVALWMVEAMLPSNAFS